MESKTNEKEEVKKCVVCKTEDAVINGRCTTCYYDCP